MKLVKEFFLVAKKNSTNECRFIHLNFYDIKRTEIIFLVRWREREQILHFKVNFEIWNKVTKNVSMFHTVDDDIFIIINENYRNLIPSSYSSSPELFFINSILFAAISLSIFFHFPIPMFAKCLPILLSIQSNASGSLLRILRLLWIMMKNWFKKSGRIWM